MDNNQMRQQSEDEIEIDLIGMLLDLWRKLPFILLITVVMALAGFIYSSFYITPMYQTSTKMYVKTTLDESKGTTISDLQMGTLLINDYAELIKSRYVLEAVIEELDLPMSTGQLAGEISVYNPDATRIITLTVRDASPIRAMQIADTVREIASEHIQNVMDIEAINVVDKAYLPTAKCSPNVQRYTMLGAAAGFVLMCAIFALRFIINDVIRTPDDIEKRLGLSCLAVIPVNPNVKHRKKKRVKY